MAHEGFRRRLRLYEIAEGIGVDPVLAWPFGASDAGFGDHVRRHEPGVHTHAVIGRFGRGPMGYAAAMAAAVEGQGFPSPGVGLGLALYPHLAGSVVGPE